MNETDPTEQSIFLSALERESLAEREAFLKEACRDNEELLASVQSLLDAYGEGIDDLEHPPHLRDKTKAYPSLAEVPGTVIGPYKLLQQIGEGGFGVVYMARQEAPIRRTVALKIIKPGMDSREVIARFESERQALAMMEHPHIARVLDVGTTDSGRPYFVMELVRGIPITEFCDTNHMPAEERLKLFLDVCHAIQHAHHKGIIHRDIKPSNILVTLHDGKPVVKVIDFGVAKAIEARLTERTLFTAFGQIIGTPTYMSPEQAEMSGLDIDTRTDIYSLGVLLYELLTGTTPVDSERLRSAGFIEMQRIIREEEAPRPSTRLSSLGRAATVLAGNRGTEPRQLTRLLAGDLDWIVMTALEKDRNRRYASPGHFAEDVQRFLRREVITARPPSPVYRFNRFVRRHRVAFVTVSIVAVTLIAGTALATWQAIRATRAQQAALHDRVVAEAALKEAEAARQSEAQERQRAEDNEQRALDAASAERTAREMTEEREKELRAVLDFLQQQILAAARPEGQAGGLGRNVTLRQTIETAAATLDNVFEEQPLIEARVRMTLGETFFHLGEAKVAAEHFRKANLIFRKLLGPDHSDTIASIHNLANSYAKLGQIHEALQLREATLAQLQTRLAEHDPILLRSMNNLAQSYLDVGRYGDALKLREETFRLRKETLGSEHPDTLRAMNNLAGSMASVGRHTDAVRAYEEALVLMKVSLGPQHPDTLRTMNNLANSYTTLGKRMDAFELRDESLRLRQANLGPDHPDTLTSMNDLASSLSELGRHEEARQLREEVLELRRAKLGADHPDTIRSMHSVASSLSSLRRYPEAIKLYEETLALRRARLGGDHPDTLHTMHSLAANLVDVGRLEDALELNEVTLAQRKVQLGANHPDTLRSMNNVASNLLAMGRIAEALPLHQEILASRKSTLGLDHPDTSGSMGTLAHSLVELRRGDEAIPLIDDCLARSKGKPVHPQLVPDLIDLRLRHFQGLRDAGGCRKTAELWEQLNRSDADSLFRAARLRAVTAAVLRENVPSPDELPPEDTEVEQAVEWLRRAIDAGFRDTARFQQDEDLAVLHNLPAFQALVTKLEANSSDQPESAPNE